MMLTLHRISFKWLLPGCLVLAALLLGPASADEAAAPTAPAAPQPLTLDQAIAAALQFNPRVAQAQQDLSAAQALVTQARAGNSVVADLEVVNSHVNKVPSFVLPVAAPPPQYVTYETISLGTSQQTQATLTIAKPLYTGGKIPAAVRQSRAGVTALNEGMRRTLQTVVSDVKQAYYGALLAADLVKVAEQAAAAAREHLRLAQAHFDAGTAPRFDVLRAEAQVADSEQVVIQARNGLNLARAALDNAMGMPQGQQYELKTAFAAPEGEVAALETLIEQAHAARPEVTQVKAQFDAAGAAADLARADKYPTLGVAWVYNRVFNSSALQVTNSTLALQATLTIFNGQQTSAAVARARSQQESARALLEQVRQGIALQVRQAYLSLGAARERIAAASKGVEQAEEAYRIATVRYDAGVSIGVEILDAQAALTAARNNHARAVYDYNIALTQLEFATGSWQPAELAATPVAPRPEQPGASPGPGEGKSTP
jgi:outer membrane protein TolC